MSWKEFFRFSDKPAATVETQPVPSRHKSPPRGSAIVEIQSASGELLALDTITCTPAPRGTFIAPDGTPSTFVIHGDDRALQEFTVAIDATLPFDIPLALRTKPGASLIRVSWSCDHA